jgi:hypothetical protein
MKTETLKNNLRNLALELEYFYTDSSFKKNNVLILIFQNEMETKIYIENLQKENA